MRRNLLLIGILVGCLIIGVAIAAVIIVTSTDDSDEYATRVVEASTTTVTPNDIALRQCHEGVRDKLKDPDSAQFKDEKVTGTSPTLSVAGQFNSRNAVGGYTGFNLYYCDTNTTTGESSVYLLS